MNSISLPNGSSLFTDLRVQSGAKNRPFSLSGVRQNLTIAPTYRGGKWWYNWIFEYRYMDDRSKGFDIYIDNYDKYNGKKDV